MFIFFYPQLLNNTTIELQTYWSTFGYISHIRWHNNTFIYGGWCVSMNILVCVCVSDESDNTRTPNERRKKWSEYRATWMIFVSMPLYIQSTCYIQFDWFCRVFDSMRLTWVDIWNLIFDLRWCVMLATGCVWLKSTEVANDDVRRIKFFYNQKVYILCFVYEYIYNYIYTIYVVWVSHLQMWWLSPKTMMIFL